MIVERIWTDNTFRNFNYLVVCPQNGEALAIDPLDHRKCLKTAADNGWQITQVLNTHEHGDHTGGNAAVIAATGAKLLAHHAAKDKISGIDRGLHAGDVVRVGRTVELEVMDTPGHTMCHVCLKSHGDRAALFCGDTLFNAGAGNCHNGGHPAELYETFARQLAVLPEDTLIYPGHDYIVNNLKFTLDREPENEAAAAMLEKVGSQDPAEVHVTTLAEEKAFNTFLRLENPDIARHLKEKFPELADRPSAKEVFLRLRELRNSW